MQGFEEAFVVLELKYCERCGGLWLRLKGSGIVFCGACAKALAGVGANEIAPLQNEVQTELATAFWAEGGHA